MDPTTPTLKSKDHPKLFLCDPTQDRMIAFINRCKNSFAYCAAVGMVCTVAVKALEILGKNFIRLSSFQGSAFITGGLAFAAFEVGFHAIDCLFSDQDADEMKYNPLGMLSGVLSTALFAYLASVPMITALAFAALRIIVKVADPKISWISNIFPESQGKLSPRCRKPSAPIVTLSPSKDTNTPLKLISRVFSCGAAAGLLFEISVRSVTWLSVGYRMAVYGGMIGTINALAVSYMCSSVFKDNLPNQLFGLLATGTISCWASPLSVPVNLCIVVLGMGIHRLTRPPKIS